MFVYIKGNIIRKAINSIVVEIGSIGYELHISSYTYEQLPNKGEVFLFTYLQVKEDLWQLFGFFSQEEKEVFLLLISVPTIGTKTALEILNAFPISNLCDAIVNQKVELIKKIKGIGKKSAERLVLELKDKVGKFILENDTEDILQDADYITDAIYALEKLGFSSNKIIPIIKKISTKLADEDKNSESIIRLVLAKLNE